MNKKNHKPYSDLDCGRLGNSWAIKKKYTGGEGETKRETLGWVQRNTQMDRGGLEKHTDGQRFIQRWCPPKNIDIEI